MPTPVDADNCPDLSIVMAATRTVGGILKVGRRSIVDYESTIHPGVTEDLCGPELERISGLVCGANFFLAYSPEHINPGDHETASTGSPKSCPTRPPRCSTRSPISMDGLRVAACPARPRSRRLRRPRFGRTAAWIVSILAVLALIIGAPESDQPSSYGIQLAAAIRPTRFRTVPSVDVVIPRY